MDSKIKKQCSGKILWFYWSKHSFEEIDIKEEIKIIGKKYSASETGIFIRKFITTTIYQCKTCEKKEEKVEIKQEILRQYR